MRGTAPALQLLSPSQERALWEEVLQELSGTTVPLDAHVEGLMAAAHRATQSTMSLSRSAVSEEEQLLVRALTEVRSRCAARKLLSLRLAPPEALQFLRDVPPPLIAGEPRLSALQEALRTQLWQATGLLAPDPSAPAAEPSLRRLPGLEDELSACARWCMERVRADSGARLLVVSACTEPSLAVQGELLWRHLAGPGHGFGEVRRQVLAVEGGAPLTQISLIRDALLALQCLEPALDTEQLYALLRSPYFDFGSQAELWSLQGYLEEWALARWSTHDLRTALATISEDAPAAGRLLNWLEGLRDAAGSDSRRATGEWARCFSDALAAAGFNRRNVLDTGEHQRFQRWGELLDEFAALDAVHAPLEASRALNLLRRLAAAGRHQASSGDAAITFTATFTDPLLDYDGIWVLGLAESRWPAAPRPDAYVALQEQRACHWPQASVTERRAQASWVLTRWQQRTPHLVLSYPEREGDLRHRPTGLVGAGAAAWTEDDFVSAPAEPGLAAAAHDQQFPAIAEAALGRPLRGGVDRLRVQQDCPFRAQAQWRLGARAPGPLSDGLAPAARGTLLHLLLQRLWDELSDHAGLLGLDADAERALLERLWRTVLEAGAVPGSRWWSRELRERERDRCLAILAEVLQQERQRSAFTVVERELKLQWSAGGARLDLRIDRVDRLEDGSLCLIDYKSGAVERVRMDKGELEPLQLALYVTAQAARGQKVSAAALYGLKPGQTGLVGVAAGDCGALPQLKPVADWDAMSAEWQQRLLQLITAHLGGEGTLARDRNACRYCHLPALCRRAPEDEREPADE